MFFDHLNTSHWVIIVLSVLLTGSLIKILMIIKNRTVIARQLAETTLSLNQLKTEYTELKAEHARIKEFQRSLHEAELTTKFQQPRLHMEEIKSSGNTPEKYLYIRSLSERGLDAREIASILAISPQEAEQLVTLAKIARQKIAGCF